jgi:hypothetical protein
LSLEDFIEIVIREDGLTASAPRQRGVSVLTGTYESFLPSPNGRGEHGGAPASNSSADVNEDTICMMLTHLALPCRDANGSLLARSSMQRHACATGTGQL